MNILRKKILSLIFALILISISLSSCNSKTDNNKILSELVVDKFSLMHLDKGDYISAKDKNGNYYLLYNHTDVKNDTGKSDIGKVDFIKDRIIVDPEWQELKSGDIIKVNRCKKIHDPSNSYEVYDLELIEKNSSSQSENADEKIITEIKRISEFPKKKMKSLVVKDWLAESGKILLAESSENNSKAIDYKFWPAEGFNVFEQIFYQNDVIDVIVSENAKPNTEEIVVLHQVDLVQREPKELNDLVITKELKDNILLTKRIYKANKWEEYEVFHQLDCTAVIDDVSELKVNDVIKIKYTKELPLMGASIMYVEDIEKIK